MSFDADAFLASSVTEANSTQLIPCPIGEYPAIISKLAPRQWASQDGTQTNTVLDVFWLIEDAGAKASCGREDVTVKQTVFLDISTATGGLDMSAGRNVPLGRLREAVGKNAPGEPFSFAMLPGLMAKVSVNHRPDKDDPSIMYAEVKMVAKLS